MVKLIILIYWTFVAVIGGYYMGKMYDKCYADFTSRFIIIGIILFSYPFYLGAISRFSNIPANNSIITFKEGFLFGIVALGVYFLISFFFFLLSKKYK